MTIIWKVVSSKETIGYKITALILKKHPVYSCALDIYFPLFSKISKIGILVETTEFNDAILVILTPFKDDLRAS